jgi:hypothetical protein
MLEDEIKRAKVEWLVCSALERSRILYQILRL